MNIAIASSGLGHVSRGIEAWAADLAAALHGRDSVITHVHEKETLDLYRQLLKN
jgi:hypothetical protein